MACTFIAIIVAVFILILILVKKRLHTITHMLICNTCVSSILFCIVQCNNYVYLGFILSETSNSSCQWRAYFAYMSISAVVYSYLVQAISRFLFSILSLKYPWVISFKMHLILILIQWIIVIVIPSSVHIQKDIIFDPFVLCWVPKTSVFHATHIYSTCYGIPIVFIVTTYIYIYIRIKRNKALTIAMIAVMRHNRDVEVLRNIMILLSIYILGGTPSLLYLITDINVFYSIGMIFVSLAVVVEKVMTMIIDHEIRHIIRQYFSSRKRRIIPI
ncbi:hypothetical protein I4U23_020040 [Adineta vaga]|nr:hypothetical protein I4U23_020040 [Adineta vaga]